MRMEGCLAADLRWDWAGVVAEYRQFRDGDMDLKSYRRTLPKSPIFNRRCRYRANVNITCAHRRYIDDNAQSCWVAYQALRSPAGLY